MIKKMIYTFIFMFFLFSNSAYSNNKIHIEGLFNFGYEPSDDIGLSMGGGIGVAYDYMELYGYTLQLRGELSMNYWSSDLNGAMLNGQKYRLMRIPVDIGARYLIDINSWWTIYPEAYVEISIDRNTVIDRSNRPYVASSGIAGKTHFRLGAAFGGGTFFNVWKDLKLGINAKYHLIRGDYFTFSPTIAYSF